MTKERVVASPGVSRRRFIGVSLAGGLAGVVPWSETSDKTQLEEDGARKLTLRVTGNSRDGYGVTVLFGTKPVARHNGGGEFSAIFQNEERCLEDRAEKWKASSWTGNESQVTLHGECKLPNLNATVSA